MSLEKDQEIARLREQVQQMHIQTGRNELEKQNMRLMRSKLDGQLDIFNQIHQFSGHAFRARSQKELYSIIPEGVVDIFQLEVGAIFDLDISGENFLLIGNCNLMAEQTVFPIEREWLARSGMIRFETQKVIVKSPPDETSPFAPLDLAHAIFVPLFDNERKMVGLILGGITNDGADMYDFEPDELRSSFMVYCQQMNGIFNNFAAIAQAKSAGEAKMRFLANLSHEIRTPMNAISGMVQIANRSSSLEEIKKCTAQIDISLRHLLGLLNDVLDISKIEDGKLTLDSAGFSLDEVVENIAGSMRQSAEDKGVRFDLRMKGTRGQRLLGDSLRLSQVLFNLLSNAIKFTPEGGAVTLDIEEKSMDSKKALIRFAVTDTGIGMSEEAASRIFTAFEQADGSTSRKFGGTGLGLTISQRIVEVMGSKIKVESVPGSGSTFSFSAWFDLDGPAQPEQAAPAAAQAPASYDFTGRRILVVDDIDINREIVLAFLEDTGAACEEAVNGRDAVEKVAASAPGYYDLILMDVQMPEMDGCDATRAIRAMDRPDARSIVILAMTANVFKEDMELVADAGMNGHIGKPVEYASTMDFIARCLGRKNT